MEKSEVLDASVLIEGASGLTTVFGIIEHPPAIRRCLVLFPDKNDFDRALEIARKLRAKGTPIGATDIVIASMCLNRNVRLVTKDSHFRYVKEVEKTLDLKIVE